MRIYHPVSRTIASAALTLIFAAAAIAFAASSQTPGSCPPIIASLFPKNASNLGGQYFPGDMGSGKGSAELSFENPTCAKQKYSVRIGVAVRHYGGETAILIKSKESPYGTIDRDADKEQAIQNATAELAQTRITPQRDKVGIGEIVYVEFKSECPPEGPAAYAARVGPKIVPNVKLKGLAWAGNARLEVTLDGQISLALAKASVAEIFANLQKTDFSKAK